MDKGDPGEKGDPGTITDEDIVRILQNHPGLKGEKGERGERGANGTNGSSFRSQDVNLWQVPNFNKVLNAIKANYEIKRGLVQNGLLADDGTVSKTSEQLLEEQIIAILQREEIRRQFKGDRGESQTLSTIKSYVNTNLGLIELKDNVTKINELLAQLRQQNIQVNTLIQQQDQPTREKINELFDSLAPFFKTKKQRR